MNKSKQTMTRFDLALRKLSRSMKWATFLTLVLMVLFVMVCQLGKYPIDQKELAEMVAPLLVLMIGVSCVAELMLAMRRKDK